MPSRKLAIAALCLSLGSPVFATDAEPIECQVRLERTEFHPGEIVQIRGYIKNPGDRPVRVPAYGNTTQFFVCTPKLTTPDGRHLSYEPLAGNPLRSSYSSAVRHPTELAAGDERLAFDLALRLSSGQPFWRTGEPPAPAELSLRPTGEYRIAFVLHVDPRDGAPADTWTGTITSDEVTFTVRELKPGKRRDEATPMQLAALEKMATLEVLDTKLLEGLQQELMLAENEGLAAAVIDYCRRDRRWAHHLIGALAARACNPAPLHGRRGRLLVGIDGPYLKTVAELTVKALCEPPADPNSLRLFTATLDATLAYLELHPKETDLRRTLIAAASQVVLQRMRRPGVAAKRAAEPPPASPNIRLSRVGGWMVLLELEVLHAGMPLDAAIDILGPPDSREKVPKAGDREALVWRLGSGNRVDPLLSLEAQDGKVVSVQQY